MNDIANFQRYSSRQLPAYGSGFTGGFAEAGGILPDDWRRLARLVDLINLLDFLGRPDPSGAIVGDVLPLVQGILRENA